MSSALDQSLDEILSSKPKRVQQKKKQQPAKSKVSKAVVKPQQQKKAKATPTGPASMLDASSYATKVIVYGLPKDIKQDAIKDFFASQIGGVSSVALTYNERGQSKGIATIVFKSAGNASKAVEKYNGAPIDGGSNKLKLELIVDPTKKPLAARIVANANSAQQKKKETPKRANAKKPEPASAKQTKENKPRNKRPAKKTVEQLDQEMTDYFEKKD